MLVKSVFGAMVELIAELTKINAQRGDIEAALEDLALPAERLDTFVAAMDAKREELVAVAQTTQFELPQLTGVKWRLDYSMMSNNVEKINSPVFLIQLQLNNAGSTIDLWVTRAQLQDLINSVKDAVKQVDRSIT